MKLDVGCGVHPSGDVNADLYPFDLLQHRNPWEFTLDVKRTKNFVRCDAQYLPFKNQVFDEVLCSHVIEHVRNPFLMISEMVRVSSNAVSIEYPHRYGEKLKIFGRPYRKRWLQEHHINHFSPKWFAQEAQKLGCSVESFTVKEMGFPHDVFRFIVLPFYMKTILRRNGNEKVRPN